MNATNATALPRQIDQPSGQKSTPLIPDPLRRIGSLDDAIGSQTGSPRRVEQIARHRDYRDRESERAAEAALLEHQRRVRAASYVPLAANLFRVH